jgi:hypothetical protein
MLRQCVVTGVCLFLAGCAGKLFTGRDLLHSPTVTQDAKLFKDAAPALKAKSVIVLDPEPGGDATEALGRSSLDAVSQRDAALISLVESERALRQAERNDDFTDGLKRALAGEGPKGSPSDPMLLDSSGRIWAVQAPRGTIPKRLHESKAVRKLLESYAAALDMTNDQGESYSQRELTSGDLSEFVKITLPYLGVGKDGEVAAAAADPQDSRTEIFNRITRYLVVYSRGKFVDRQGKKLEKPEIKEKTISDDAITGAVSVIIEAITDSCIRVPVFFEEVGGKKKWITATGGDAEPTAAVLDKSLEVNIANAPAHIGKAEIRLIQYLGQGAGMSGHAVAGFLIRALGKLDLGQFALAGISIGDNQIVAKLIDTIFETGSRRLTEANVYKYLQAHDEASRPSWLKQLLVLIGQVYDQTDGAP